MPTIYILIPLDMNYYPTHSVLSTPCMIQPSKAQMLVHVYTPPSLCFNCRSPLTANLSTIVYIVCDQLPAMFLFIHLFTYSLAVAHP